MKIVCLVLPRTVRAKLAAATLGGLLLVLLMALLLVAITHSAYHVVRKTHVSYDRVYRFSLLHAAAEHAHTLMYASIRDASMEPALKDAVADFRAALKSVEELPQRSEREQRVAGVIRQQGRDLLDLLTRGPAIVRAADEQWRLKGSRAAMQEIQAQSLPYFTLLGTIAAEMHDGEPRISTAAGAVLAQQRQATYIAAAGVTLSCLFSVAVFITLVTRLGHGLQQLSRGAQAFRAGHLDHRVQITGDDEFSQLANVLNSMAQETSEKHRGIEEARANLEQAVTERTAQLKSANVALATADERRRLFLAEASHELRIPLTIIRGEAQLALRASPDIAPEVNDALTRILDQTQDLTRLLDDLFLIARAEAGGLQLDLATLDVCDLVRRVAQDFATLACDTGARIDALADGTLPVRADARRVRQALAALIDNALRHTREGVHILVEAREESSDVMLAVEDNGPGLEWDDADALFGHFRRGRQRGEGSGLGLSVVRALAEVHGGCARLERGAQGGVRAMLLLPKRLPKDNDRDAPVAAGDQRSRVNV